VFLNVRPRPAAGMGLGLAVMLLPSANAVCGPPAEVSAASQISPQVGPATVQVPLAVSINPIEVTSSQGCVLPVVIEISAPSARLGSVGTLRVALVAAGVAHVVGETDRVLNWDPAGYSQHYRADVEIEGLGEGSVRVTATELDSSERPRWGPSDQLFVLRTPNGLLTGKSSGLELWREMIRRDLVAGRITQSTYRRKLRELLEQGKLDLDGH